MATHNMIQESLAEVNWYRRFFVANEHENFMAQHDDFRGTVIVSLLVTATHYGFQYWTVTWRRDRVSHFVIHGDTTPLSLPEILAHLDPSFAKNAKIFRRVTAVAEVRACARLW